MLKLDTRPDGASAKILTFLQTYRDQLAEVVALVVCDGKGKNEFTITAHHPLAETDRGALACRAFCEGLTAGTTDLRHCVKSLAAPEVAGLASVKRRSSSLVGAPAAPASIVPPPTPAGDPVVIDGKKGA